MMHAKWENEFKKKIQNIMKNLTQNNGLFLGYLL